MTSPSLADDTRTVRFRGANYDEAVAAARDAVGPRARVVAANRVRRGGLGGFFATDLGVEVSVVPEGESIDDALERLVDETAAADRSLWLQQLAAATANTPHPAPAHAPIAAPITAPGATATTIPAPVPTATTIPTVDAAPAQVADVPAAPAAPAAPDPAIAPAAKRPAARTSPAKPRAPRRTATAPPSKAHVDLAVRAVADLIKAASGSVKDGKVTIQLVLTTESGQSVSAEATIERGGRS